MMGRKSNSSNARTTKPYIYVMGCSHAKRINFIWPFNSVRAQELNVSFATNILFRSC